MLRMLSLFLISDICQIPLFVLGYCWQWKSAGGCFGHGFNLAVREDSGVVLFGVGFYLVVSLSLHRSCSLHPQLRLYATH